MRPEKQEGSAMSNVLDGIQDYLGVGELRFDLSARERRNFRIASTMPTAAILAVTTRLVIDVLGVDYNDEFWDRLATTLLVVEQPLILLGLAALFIFGIGPVTRSQGSWSFVITTFLIFAGFSAGLYATAGFAVLPDEDIRDFRLYFAQFFAIDFGLLAIGYAFVAYRGLTHPELFWEDEEPS
jgi:hypothetical protein